MSGSAVNTTNNRMELTALLEGLKAIKNRQYPVAVFSDSAYIVNCFQQKWYLNWLKSGWLNSKKQPVENRDLWQQILNLVSQHPKVDFYKVKGHLKADDSVAIKKWHAKFLADYQTNLPFEVYQQAVNYNIRVDALAGLKLYGDILGPLTGHDHSAAVDMYQMIVNECEDDTLYQSAQLSLLSSYLNLAIHYMETFENTLDVIETDDDNTSLLLDRLIEKHANFITQRAESIYKERM